MKFLECLSSEIRKHSLSRVLVSPVLWGMIGLAAARSAALWTARSAYAQLLPAVPANVHWNYTEFGALDFAVGIGGFIGVKLAPYAERVFGCTLSFAVGVSVAASALLAIAVFRDFPILMIGRFMAGLASGPLLISGFSLAVRSNRNDRCVSRNSERRP
ncbi:MAG: YbfB/YjiJ family MFS transporter [Gammaproteobacteria bacterium]|nr:YbfB/YjiJ family MFS transporter [Gammaproteobacteria bacterium]MBU6509834.1 YbfB/YjiJ family MFS transporter [Gammaproteobacteria bacterium]MDE1983648.1 YbfB/YjiJ family MFS transporter [Gammaproteobacteria bacterium]MDE2108706.1 YbfB/YjiJ family MFS transporter [Gammaproteobacteria bacterium]MDE2460032.1 YbfB/YjiJ family MFS transporter [Gammaproteobacteria bacterium]